jgi:RNA polymerase sigma factor (sigma-70 family)
MNAVATLAPELRTRLRRRKGERCTISNDESIGLEQEALELLASRSHASASDDDLELIEGLQDGNDAALNEIMDRYREPLFAFIFRHVGNATDAADLLEETFVKVYLNRNRYQPTAKFRTWLYTIATNLCRDWARRRKRKPAIPVAEIYENQIIQGCESDRLLPNQSSPVNEVQEAEEAIVLHAAIASLPPDLKSAIILFSLEGHSQHEAAEILGCSAKAVETRVYRAKKLLKVRLEELIAR